MNRRYLPFFVCFLISCGGSDTCNNEKFETEIQSYIEAEVNNLTVFDVDVQQVKPLTAPDDSLNMRTTLAGINGRVAHLIEVNDELVPDSTKRKAMAIAAMVGERVRNISDQIAGHRIDSVTPVGCEVVYDVRGTFRDGRDASVHNQVMAFNKNYTMRWNYELAYDAYLKAAQRLFQ